MSLPPKPERPKTEIKTKRTSEKVLHIPKVKSVKSKPLKTSRPSFFSRLFSKKTKPAASSSSEPKVRDSDPKETDEKKTSEKVFHIPKIESAKDQASPDLLAGNISVSKRESEKAESESEDRVVMPHGSGLSVKEQKGKEKFAPEPPKLARFKAKDSKPKKKFSFWKIFTGEKDKKDKRTSEERLDERGKRLDVNLIPEEFAKKPEVKLSRKLFIGGMVVFISVLLVGGGYLGISWYQIKITEQIKGLETEIAILNQQISKYEKGKSVALELQRHLGIIHQLLDDHIYWTQFFALLEKYTIDEVYFTNFSMAGGDNLSISAIGRDYNSVAKQLVVFQNATDFVRSVRIDAASAEIDQEEGSYAGVSFNINLEFLSDIFLKPIE